MRVLGLGALAVEQRVVHIERYGPASLEHLERFAMVLGADHEHIGFVFSVITFEKALIGGAGSGHHILARKVGKAFDPAVLGREQLALYVDKPVGECHLLLALSRHAGGPALQVDSAVLHQRDAGLGRHQVVLHLEVAHCGFLLNTLDNPVCQVHRVAHRFTTVIPHVGKRHRRIAVAKGDGLGAGDLAQSALQWRFGCMGLCAQQKPQRAAGQQDCFHCYSPWVFEVIYGLQSR